MSFTMIRHSRFTDLFMIEDDVTGSLVSQDSGAPALFTQEDALARITPAAGIVCGHCTPNAPGTIRHATVDDVRWCAADHYQAEYYWESEASARAVGAI